MDKEEALGDFLKGLRIAINNSLAYSRQHPYFLKSAQDFKVKIENLFSWFPLKSGLSFVDANFSLRFLTDAD